MRHFHLELGYPQLASYAERGSMGSTDRMRADSRRFAIGKSDDLAEHKLGGHDHQTDCIDRGRIAGFQLDGARRLHVRRTAVAENGKPTPECQGYLPNGTAICAAVPNGCRISPSLRAGKLRASSGG